jgi:Glycosyl transferase family 2
MRFAVVTCAHNECELIGPLLRHYEAHGAEVVILIDNESDDGTVEAARAVRSDIEVRPLVTGGLDDAAKAAALDQARWSLAGRVDYVCVVDADEFLVPLGHGLTIREALAELPPADAYGALGWQIIPGPDEGALDLTQPLAKQRCWGIPDELYNKPIVLRPELPARLSLGQHYFEPPPPGPLNWAFLLLHMAGASEELWMRRRLQMRARQTPANSARGGGRAYDPHITDEELRGWWLGLLARRRRYQLEPAGSVMP